ncbi:helix-turn-helix domain containing protein [Phenylobacterium sp. LH3H17]|uniref:helix-turn-helix domain-containing protein n=1 Tax=Phenylobacterium sp. LH3H17 TaxID=2903901 RepID=UPI0020C9F08E|nr:helix-turn-helix domain-containing protein [Phenylobacterium sp. LH3H17]UTP40182.1 helix-turn-helix domain containing protein [Phenylobacterium sp. LH3H17]
MALADWTPPTKGVTPAFTSGFTVELRAEVLRAMARGESLHAICRRPGMPTPPTVYRWAEKDPQFGEAFHIVRREARRRRAQEMLARRAARPPKVKKRNCPGSVSTYSEARAEAICLGLIKGRSLAAICRDRGMPTIVTVYNWLHRYPAFAADYGLSRRLQADMLSDRLIGLIDGAKPSTLRAALKHVRHRTAVLSAKAWDPDDRPEAAAEVGSWSPSPLAGEGGPARAGSDEGSIDLSV